MLPVLNQANSIMLSFILFIIIDPRSIGALFGLFLLGWLTSCHTGRVCCLVSQFWTCPRHMNVVLDGSTRVFGYLDVGFIALHFIIHALILACRTRHIRVWEGILFIFTIVRRFRVTRWLVVVVGTTYFLHTRLRRNALTTPQIWVPHLFGHLIVWLLRVT